jgi:uncharacterized protein (TIGR03085 family)
MTNPARSERHALCDLFMEVGPDAPTLCGEWTTRDLAAHLVVRESRPDAAAGILLKAAASHGDKVRREVARQPWGKLVENVRNGPPWWSPTRLGVLDKLTNTVEFFVHHEDVRRGGDVIEPRALDDELADTLWTAVGRMAKMMTRKAPGGLVLCDPDRGSITANGGNPSVTVNGPVGELVLFVYGRQRHSAVSLDGPVDLVAAMRTASFGI